MKKVLIVDDDSSILFLISEVLSRNNYEPLLAYNGKEAMDLVRVHRPALVVLDIMMPGINGFEVCKKIKGDPELKDTRIILLTAKTKAADIQLGLAAGAESYFTKPFKIAELLAKIKELIG
ncbi:MAG TPA: response regulator [Candidatus Edwardsbacteria bacterium]|nr:response regulator [Candidatus Edwardsbacteria bacterium]